MYNFGSKSFSLLISKKSKENPETKLRRGSSTIIKESQKFKLEEDKLQSHIYQFYLLEMKGHLD